VLLVIFDTYDVGFLNTKMQQILTDVIRSVFPLETSPESIVAPHAWRDRRYVGEVDGHPSTWRGFSANLRKLDFRYRGTYIDIVDNELPEQEQLRLFGSAFVDASREYRRYIVLYVLDFPATTEDFIIRQGFTPRRMPSGKILHACKIVGIDEFVSHDPLVWICHLIRMIILQRFLSIHRKPFEENEIPLQNLLYQSGYLHRYIVDHGLALHELSVPRPTGQFGHDFHAMVSHRSFLLNTPFPLGIEVFVGPLGYHADTIQQYIREFGLAGMIVIAKDNPFDLLQAVWTLDRKPTRAVRLLDILSTDGVAVHHLPLEQIMLDLTDIRVRFDEIVPVFR